MKIAQQVSSLDYKVTLPPELAAEYGELRWKLIVGKKPRGLWRPPLTIEFYHEERGKNNPLNIDPKWKCPLFRLPIWKNNGCSSAGALEHAPVAPFMLYRQSSCHENKHIYICCSENPGFGGWDMNFFTDHTREYYLEWRPGKPDYSDVLEWFARNICIPAVEEYNRRILEAYESEPIEEEILSSDDLELQIRQEKIKKEIEKKPSRKLRVA